MTFPLVSVAIPAYNHARYIEACISSICAQTYPELELVVLDDGSSDETYALAECFVAKHKGRFRRVLVETQDNQGVSATSNACIEKCTGEWVHLLGSDDVIYPDKIMAEQRAIAEWGNPLLALVYADVDYLDEHGHVLRTQRQDKRPRPGVDVHAYTWLCEGNAIPNPTVALRRQAFIDAGGFDSSLRLEDWDCWLRLAARFPIARVPAVLGGYRYHPTNSSKRQGMMMEAVLLTFAKFLEAYPELVREDQRRHVYRKNLRQIWRWARKSSANISVLELIHAFIRASWNCPTPDQFRQQAVNVRCADGGGA